MARAAGRNDGLGKAGCREYAYQKLCLPLLWGSSPAAVATATFGKVATSPCFACHCHLRLHFQRYKPQPSTTVLRVAKYAIWHPDCLCKGYVLCYIYPDNLCAGATVLLFLPTLGITVAKNCLVMPGRIAALIIRMRFLGGVYSSITKNKTRDPPK